MEEGHLSHGENVNRDKCLQEWATVVAAPGPGRRKGVPSLLDDTPCHMQEVDKSQ